MNPSAVSYDDLHQMITTQVRESDEKQVSEIVNTIYNRVVASAKLGYCNTVWESDYNAYKYKHIVLATNRLRVLFPGSVVEQKKGHTITVDWY